MAETTAILDLSTTIQRQFITIDKTKYFLKTPSEFSLIERHEIAACGKRMEQLKEIGEAEARDKIEDAQRALRETFIKLVMNAESIVDKVNDEQKLQVVNCFFEQAPATPPENTLKSRRGSKGSTGANRKTG